MVQRLAASTAALCLLAALPRPAPAATPKSIVAVFSIETRGVKLKPGVLVSLTTYLGSKLSESGEFEVVPQDKLKEALAAKKKDSYKQCYNQSCQIEIGQELAANRALSTQVMKVGTKCMVTCNLYDLKKATSGKAATAKGPCSEDGITASLDAVVEKLARAVPAAAAPAPAPGAGKLSSVWSGSSAAPAAPAPGTGGLPETLTRSDIQSGMRKIASKVQGCYDRFRAPGSAFVTITIAPAGVVSAVQIKGVFAGKPTGACLEAAARLAVFPRFKGQPVTITYPFILR
jgi:hypothetical protein